MAKLPKYTLGHNKKAKRWEVKNSAGESIKSFKTKDDATAGGVLERAIGPGGGSVRIKKMDGKIQEERTFPRASDPKRSPG